MKNTIHKKITEQITGQIKNVLLMLIIIALVRPTTSCAIVGYEPTGGAGEGEMHIMSEGMYEQQPQQQESEEMRAMPEPYESSYGPYAGRGYEKRPGMDVQGRMVRPGPQLDPEEVMALDVGDGQGQARIMETGEVRALGSEKVKRRR